MTTSSKDAFVHYFDTRLSIKFHRSILNDILNNKVYQFYVTSLDPKVIGKDPHRILCFKCILQGWKNSEKKILGQFLMVFQFNVYIKYSSTAIVNYHLSQHMS